MALNKTESKNRKFNILFISSDCNFFIDNNANFSRMYNNLFFFHNHKDFNVIVLQPDKERKLENISLKKNIICYYFKKFYILGNNFFTFNDFNPFFITKIIKILKKHRIDLIHMEFNYGMNILRFITKTPVSCNSYNIEYIFWEEIAKYYYKIPIFLRSLIVKYSYFLEKYAIKFAKNVNAVTYQDKKKLIELYNIPKEKIIVSSYGYVKKIFNKPIKQEEAREGLGIDKNKFIVIFHGYYLMEANIESLNLIKDKIAPQIKDENILFLIAGKKLPPYKNTRNVRYLGYVEDLREFLYSADVAIVPVLRGTGIKTKVLDYLSAIIPVISTKLGAEGLLIENGVHGYIVDVPIEDIKKRILELKNNHEKIKYFKKNIKNLLDEKYKWEEISKILANRYIDIIKKR